MLDNARESFAEGGLFQNGAAAQRATIRREDFAGLLVEVFQRVGDAVFQIGVHRKSVAREYQRRRKHRFERKFAMAAMDQ